MNKPKLYVFDFKPVSYYDPVSDIVSVSTGIEIPSKIVGLDGIILHNAGLARSRDCLHQARDLNIPVIEHVTQNMLLETIQQGLRRENFEYDKLYYVQSYPELFNLVREIFS